MMQSASTSCCLLLAILAMSACNSDTEQANTAAVDIAPVQAPAGPAQKGASAGDLAESCGAPIDTNGNGSIEEPEYLSFRGFAFDNWDADNDERITPAEFHACWRGMGWGDSASAFASFDENDDGAVGQEEFFEPEAFKRADANGNAVLEPGESMR